MGKTVGSSCCILLLLLALKIVGTGADDGRVDDTSDSTIKLSSTETELLKKALEEAAEQASLPAAGETTQFLRKKTETLLKADGSASPSRRTLI